MKTTDPSSFFELQYQTAAQGGANVCNFDENRSVWWGLAASGYIPGLGSVWWPTGKRGVVNT